MILIGIYTMNRCLYFLVTKSQTIIGQKNRTLQKKKNKRKKEEEKDKGKK